MRTTNMKGVEIQMRDAHRHSVLGNPSINHVHNCFFVRPSSRRVLNSFFFIIKPSAESLYTGPDVTTRNATDKNVLMVYFKIYILRGI